MSPMRSTRRTHGVLRTSKEPIVVGDERDDASADADSEDSATEMVTRLAQRMISSTRKRRRARRNELKSDFLKQSEGILKSIDSTFGDQAKSKIMKSGLERIGALLKRKAEIEEKIFLHIITLEKAYMDANQELAVTMKGRKLDKTLLAAFGPNVKQLAWGA